MSYALFLLAATMQLTSNCGGKLLLQKVTPQGEVTVEKTVDGPLAAPVLAIMQDGKESYALLDDMMTNRAWESKGTFSKTIKGDMSKWQSVELQCPATSPWGAAAWPGDVVYKKGDDAAIAAKVALLKKALASEKGFATPSLCGDGGMVLIGPNLYEAIRADTAGIESPKVVTIDSQTGKQRAQLRVKGERELSILAAALRKHVGTASPRIRAATYDELAAHWLNIGWDINEPLLIADYGAHRLVLDYMDGAQLFMIDELP